MSAGPMRFPSRSRWVLWLILLFALGPFLLILPASLWLGWTMNPVQTYYLGTYTACSLLSGYIATTAEGLPSPLLVVLKYLQRQPALAEFYFFHDAIEAIRGHLDSSQNGLEQVYDLQP